MIYLDNFYRGFVAGLVGGIIINIWNLTSYHISHFTNLRFLDWSAIFLYGHMPNTVGESAFALFIQLGFAGALGVFFARFIKTFGDQWIYLKGLIAGIGIFFILYSLPVLFRVPELLVIPFNTVISNNIGASIWGLTTAAVYHYLQKNYV